MNSYFCGDCIHWSIMMGCLAGQEDKDENDPACELFEENPEAFDD